ncbi:MAG: DeoR family transcriptional regulator [Candidatus Odinarchaeota archaeon]|nr:DeoR family transcriptional regulator [Candidatus Odinarchaeota archaeon]
MGFWDGDWLYDFLRELRKMDSKKKNNPSSNPTRSNTESSKYSFFSELAETLKNLTEKINEMSERIYRATDLTSRYLDKITGKVNLELLETSAILIKSIIAELCHEKRLNEKALEVLDGYLLHMIFSTDDLVLQEALGVCVAYLRENPDIENLRNVERFLDALRDELAEKPTPETEVKRTLENILIATRFYVDDLSLQRIKTQLENIINKLVAKGKFLVRNDFERRQFLDGAFRFLGKLEGVRTAGELHSILKQHFSDIMRLHYLITESSQQPTLKPLKKEIQLSTSEKILKLLYDSKCFHNSPIFLPTRQIVAQIDKSEITVRRNLQKLSEKGHIVKVTTKSREVGWRLTEIGEQVIKQLLSV